MQDVVHHDRRVIREAEEGRPRLRSYAAAAAGAGPASMSRLRNGSTRKLSPSRLREPSRARSPVCRIPPRRRRPTRPSAARLGARGSRFPRRRGTFPFRRPRNLRRQCRVVPNSRGSCQSLAECITKKTQTVSLLERLESETRPSVYSAHAFEHRPSTGHAVAQRCTPVLAVWTTAGRPGAGNARTHRTKISRGSDNPGQPDALTRRM